MRSDPTQAPANQQVGAAKSGRVRQSARGLRLTVSQDWLYGTFPLPAAGLGRNPNSDLSPCKETLMRPCRPGKIA